MFFLILLSYHLKLSDRLHDLVLSDEVLVLICQKSMSGDKVLIQKLPIYCLLLKLLFKFIHLDDLGSVNFLS